MQATIVSILKNKYVKITVITISCILFLMWVIPFAFRGKITAFVKEQINEQVNATINFDHATLNLFTSFPDVSVDVKNFVIINKAPFKGDTLAYAEHTYFDMSLESLMGDKPIIHNISLENGVVNIHYDKNNNANYDIALPSEEPTPKTEVAFEIQRYEVKNLTFNYYDELSDMKMSLANINHLGKGDFTKDVLNLDTETTAQAFNFSMEGVSYLKDLKVSHKAMIGVDMTKDLKIIFKNNIAKLNELDLTFNGDFTMLPEGFGLDFTFDAKGNEFKNFLSLVPHAYTANFSNVVTEGKLDLKGKIKGVYSDTEYPAFDISIKTNQAMVKYPDFAKKIEKINIDTRIENPTNNLDNTHIIIHNFSFGIDQDVFALKMDIKNPLVNPLIEAAFKGQVNLGNLKNAYPIPDLGFALNGILKADLSTKFDMAQIEKAQYGKIKTNGNAEVFGMKLVSAYTPKPLFINHAKVGFNLNNVVLNDLNVKTGKSDIKANGKLENVYGYVFNNTELKSSLNVTSNNFVVSDFLSLGETTTTTTTAPTETPTNTTQFKLPNLIAFEGSVNAKKIVYDNLILTNFTGKSVLKNQKISFNNANANMFKGMLGLNGYVDTKPSPTVYDFDVKIKQFDIASTFNMVEMLGKIAPIAKAFNGRFDTNLKVSGALGNDLMPLLESLSGEAFANLQVDKVDASKNKFLSLADQKIPFLNLNKTDLKDLKGRISFSNGQATLAPITYKIKDIPFTISGTHSFTQNIAYDMKFDLPAKYLGTEASNLIKQLSGNTAETLLIPFNVKVGGTITKPTITTGIKDALAILTKKVIAEQKAKATEKVKETVKNQATKQVNNLLTSKTPIKSLDSVKTNTQAAVKTATEKAKTQVKETGTKLLKGVFGK